MQNVTITVDGVTKKLELIENKKGSDCDFHLIGGRWYKEIEEVEVKPDDKNYKVIAFRNTRNPNIFYRLRFGKFINTLGLSFSLNEMLKYVKEGGIEVYKVKRLFDNYLITVGDVNELGKIEKIDMIGEKDCLVKYAEIEEVKPDYKIISFTNSKGNVWIEKGGAFILDGENYEWHSLADMLKYVKSNWVTIKSVQRLSDNQVFTVGNGMNYNKDGTCYVIEKFTLREGKICINEHNNDFTIEDWILYVKPTVILTTEDGVEITDRKQTIYFCNPDFDKYDFLVGDLGGGLPRNKYFSTEAARDEYILMNKPITLTLKEYNESRYPISDLFKSKQKLIKPEFPTDRIG